MTHKYWCCNLIGWNGQASIEIGSSGSIRCLSSMAVQSWQPVLLPNQGWNLKHTENNYLEKQIWKNLWVYPRQLCLSAWKSRHFSTFFALPCSRKWSVAIVTCITYDIQVDSSKSLHDIIQLLFCFRGKVLSGNGSTVLAVPDKPGNHNKTKVC